MQLPTCLCDDCAADDEYHLEKKQPYLSFHVIHLITIDVPQGFVHWLFSAYRQQQLIGQHTSHKACAELQSNAKNPSEGLKHGVMIGQRTPATFQRPWIAKSNRSSTQGFGNREKDWLLRCSVSSVGNRRCSLNAPIRGGAPVRSSVSS